MGGDNRTFTSLLVTVGGRRSIASTRDSSIELGVPRICSCPSAKHRGQGIAKALVRTVLQFARDQGCSDAVLQTTVLMHGAVAPCENLGFQDTGKSFFNTTAKLLTVSSIHFRYPLPSAQEYEL
ncbi:N-acetyltransferase 8 [Lemmus lemmus]